MHTDAVDYEWALRVLQTARAILLLNVIVIVQEVATRRVKKRGSSHKNHTLLMGLVEKVSRGTKGPN